MAAENGNEAHLQNQDIVVEEPCSDVNVSRSAIMQKFRLYQTHSVVTLNFLVFVIQIIADCCLSFFQ